MTMRREHQWETLEDLTRFLSEVSSVVDVIVVEGIRDVEALRELGYAGRVEVYSHAGLNESDVALLLSGSREVLVLTDFDAEGGKLATRLSELLESNGARVNREARRAFGKMLGALGANTVESLDNIKYSLEKET